jgi:hypothetical protein
MTAIAVFPFSIIPRQGAYASRRNPRRLSLRAGCISCNLRGAQGPTGFLQAATPKSLTLNDLANNNEPTAYRRNF